jgi:hypothetical protein
MVVVTRRARAPSGNGKPPVRQHKHMRLNLFLYRYATPAGVLIFTG